MEVEELHEGLVSADKVRGFPARKKSKVLKPHGEGAFCESPVDARRFPLVNAGRRGECEGSLGGKGARGSGLGRWFSRNAGLRLSPIPSPSYPWVLKKMEYVEPGRPERLPANGWLSSRGISSRRYVMGSEGCLPHTETAFAAVWSE